MKIEAFAIVNKRTERITGTSDVLGISLNIFPTPEEARLVLMVRPNSELRKITIDVGEVVVMP